MKKMLIISILITLYNCSSISYTKAQKIEVLKTGQFEEGNKENGVIIMSITFDPRTEEVKMNIPETEANAGQVCKNWGYSGKAKFDGGDSQAKCISFNNNGGCMLRKLPFKVICQ